MDSMIFDNHSPVLPQHEIQFLNIRDPRIGEKVFKLRNFCRCFRSLHICIIARKYDSTLAELCEHEDLGVRDQLAYLGIYARPELYEMAGNVSINTHKGSIDLHAAGDCGLALPSTVVDDVVSFDLHTIRSITFIENKTNYDEYIRAEKQHDELVIYHGGFISPKKRALFSKLAIAAQGGIVLRFWGDIDLGGFQMYEQLQKTFPNVQPMRMSASEVEKYCHNGLARPEEYLCKLRTSHFNLDGSQFKPAIDKITEYGVTIEQEAYLAECAPCDLACV